MPDSCRLGTNSYCCFSSSSGSKKLERTSQKALTLKKSQRVRRLNIETKLKISVVGVNGIGAELVGRIAQERYRVIAVDKMSSIVRNICKTQLSETREPLNLAYAGNQKFFSATTDLIMALKCSEISIFSDIVFKSEQHAPGNERMAPNGTIVEIAQALKCISCYHSILFYGGEDISIIKNTCIPAIEQISAKQLGRDFGVSCVVKKRAESCPFKSLYVKGFDKKSELNIRRLYKNTKIKTEYFDFSDAV